MRVKLAAILAGLILSAATLGPSALAQPQTGWPPTNATVEELLKRLSAGDQTVELRGYVGPSSADTIRLYQSLTLSRYYEIPRDAVLHFVQDGDPKTSPIRVFVRGSAMIVTARRQSAGTVALASSRPPMLASTRSDDPPIQVDHCFWYCLAAQTAGGAGAVACAVCYLTQ